MRRPRPCSRRPRGCSPSSSCAPATPRPCTRPAGRPVGWSRRRASGSPRPSARGRARSSVTSGGTEADNLAVKGMFWSRRNAGQAAPTPARVRRGAPRRAGPGVLDGRARGRRAGAAAGRRRRGARRRRAARGAGAQRRPGRADLRDVGEQRGRQRCSRSTTWSRSRAGTACPCTPTRCRPSARCRSTSVRRGSTR